MNHRSLALLLLMPACAGLDNEGDGVEVGSESREAKGGGQAVTASSVSYVPSGGLTATNVQDGLDETAARVEELESIAPVPGPPGPPGPSAAHVVSRGMAQTTTLCTPDEFCHVIEKTVDVLDAGNYLISGFVQSDGLVKCSLRENGGDFLDIQTVESNGGSMGARVPMMGALSVVDRTATILLRCDWASASSYEIRYRFSVLEVGEVTQDYITRPCTLEDCDDGR